MIAIRIALIFLVAAALAVFLPPQVRHGAWLPLHLALAGSATAAIAGIMPYFSAALAAAPPARARYRTAAVIGCAVGASCISVGVIAAIAILAGAGGIIFIGGVVLTGVVTVIPLEQALAPNRGIVPRGYVAALVFVGIGAGLATLYLGGWTPIVLDWAKVKPAHAWLNLIGFISLVIVTTLLHLFPTVVGTRIVVRRSARWAVYGLVCGTPLIALGLIITTNEIAWMGAALVEAGAVALALNILDTWHRRGHWRTDPGWHAFVTLALISATSWFEVGVAIAAGRLVIFGATPTSWSIEAVIAPLVVGWVGFAVLAATSHLIPAVGPGDQIAHARQRAILGRFAVLRLSAANTGVVVLAIGVPLGLETLVTAGTLIVLTVLATTAVLVVASISVGSMATMHQATSPTSTESRRTRTHNPENHEPGR